MTTAANSIAEADAPSQPHNGFSLISNEKLIQLYTTMLKCNLLEQRLHAPQKQLTQEASAVGVIADLLPGDTLAPSTGGWMQAFVKGLSIDHIAAATSGGRVNYAAFNVIPPSLKLGAQLDRAITAAKENKKRRNKKIVAAFCGAANDSPEFNEAMRKAGKSRLPILLVCHSGSDESPLFLKAKEYGFPCVIVDADDAVGVYRVVTEAMTHARRGNGPTLIECKPWLVSGRATGERKSAGNPIANMERYLTRKGLFNKKLKSGAVAAFGRELDAAFKIAVN